MSRSGRDAATADAVVVGGGLVGCLAARALAGAGLSVVLCERGLVLGGEASTAAAGLLTPQMEAVEGILVAPGRSSGRRRDAMLDLCLAARRAYPEFVRALEAETGREVHYRGDGTLVVALDAREAGTLARRGAEHRARGLRADWLEGEEARVLEPALTTAALGALHLPDDHQVDNVALVEAAGLAVRGRDRIAIRTGTPVEGLAIRGRRLVGVEARGEVVTAPWVVLAAGAWSAGLARLPRPAPIRPVKGQMAALRPEPMVCRCTVGGGGVYCVPRDDGRVLIGATVEEAGFDKGVDPAAIEKLRVAAARVVPALARAPLDAAWAGLRPGTADDLPILGADPEVEGLIWATGHYRNGILLAPITAGIVAAVVRGDPPPLDLSPFAPDRWSG